MHSQARSALRTPAPCTDAGTGAGGTQAARRRRPGGSSCGLLGPAALLRVHPAPPLQQAVGDTIHGLLNVKLALRERHKELLLGPVWEELLEPLETARTRRNRATHTPSLLAAASRWAGLHARALWRTFTSALCFCRLRASDDPSASCTVRGNASSARTAPHSKDARTRGSVPPECPETHPGSGGRLRSARCLALVVRHGRNGRAGVCQPTGLPATEK